jgi:hypothetical protein
MMAYKQRFRQLLKEVSMVRDAVVKPLKIYSLGLLERAE